MLHERKSANGHASHCTANDFHASHGTTANGCHASDGTISDAESVAMIRSSPQRRGVLLLLGSRIPLIGLTAVLALLQAKTLFYDAVQGSRSVIPAVANGGLHASANQGMLMQDDESTQECRWWLAESSIPHGGLGVHTAFALHKNDMVGFPDLCLFVSDAPTKWADHLHSHSYGSMFFGQHEGRNNRAACLGFTTIFNTAPLPAVNSLIVSPVIQTNAGLHRAISPGAGAISHHYGITARAKDVITAGSELTVDYFDWEWTEQFYRPARNVSWLQDNGWCIDNVYIKQSTIPDAGRGAFLRRPVRKGDTVAPTPLQVFVDRKVFQHRDPEQLFVNYCLQPSGSTMLFFPYGPTVGLINHALTPHTPNVAWRWSTQTNSTHHDPKLFDLRPNPKLWDEIPAGKIVLEVYALRDIVVGEELLLDYGHAWESAWNEHVANWKPPSDASKYVYPAELDETTIVRTVKEQKRDPYPDNIGFICFSANTADRSKKRLEWSEPKEHLWWESFTPCHVVYRKWDAKTDTYLYAVELMPDNKPESFKFNKKTPATKRFIDTMVPRRAIRFVEIPYMDDEHLKGAFRHPLGFPDELVPEAWKNAPE
jgi:hypothetical protein